MLSNLKVGDKVICKNNYNEYITTVTKITPTGRIRVENHDSQFDKNGRELGGDVWNAFYLIPWTKEAEDIIRDKKIIRKAYKACTNVRLEDLTITKARKILEILG